MAILFVGFSFVSFLFVWNEKYIPKKTVNGNLLFQVVLLLCIHLRVANVLLHILNTEMTKR